MVFNALNHFKFMRKKVFKGHMVAGYACGLDFSPEMRCIQFSSSFSNTHNYVDLILNLRLGKKRKRKLDLYSAYHQ